ncbi:unnamed protein product, partial [Merluccius merluccius]
MVAPTMAIFALCFLQSSAFIHHNGSGPLLRTFAGHYVTVPDEPTFDLLDGVDEDAAAGSGSGMEQPPPRHPVEKRNLSHPPKRRYRVSPEAQDFLRGRLSTVLVPTVYTLVFVVSVPLNLAAVVMFLRRIRQKKPAVIYMLNLACADLLFVLVLPLKIAYHYHGNDWVFGRFLCRLVTAAFYCNMYCSVLLMTCISLDRFVAVVYPMNALAWRRPKMAYAVCAAMWLLAAGGVAPLLLSGQTVHLPDLGVTTCHDVQDSERLQAYYRFFFPVYAALFFFLPLVLNVACYARIVRALAAANVQNRARKTRAVVMAVAVLVVFVVCFAPSNVLMMVHYGQLAHGNAGADASYRAYLLSMCAGTLSCCLDPLIYYFGSSQCQKQVVALLTCKGLAGAAAAAAGLLALGQQQRQQQADPQHQGQPDGGPAKDGRTGRRQGPLQEADLL